ncbi:MAG: hypothetical protein PHX27_02285 [Candidatus ainarchaeum sp.]|nr:hypothetical protein [Candidatus ainarchaeum sp.]
MVVSKNKVVKSISKNSNKLKKQKLVLKSIKEKVDANAVASTVNQKKQKTVLKSIKKKVDSNAKNTADQKKEIEKLKLVIGDLKKKKKTNVRRVSEYNLFIRKQILSGLTFERAVKEWNKFKKLELKQKRKPSAYNQFIGSQMKLGKTFMESVKLWRLAKEGKLGRKGSTRTVTKTIVKTVKSKPKIIVKTVQSKPKIVEKIKYRTRTKEISKPCPPSKIVEKNILDYDKLREMFSEISTKINMQNSKQESISITDIKSAVESDDEEIAFKLVQTYFIEIARFGFKKQLTLDEIIDAYLYSLTRVKMTDSKELDLAEKVKKAGITK